jgi:Ty3 transposon capsid-like protein/Zinc knuckle
MVHTRRTPLDPQGPEGPDSSTENGNQGGQDDRQDDRQDRPQDDPQDPQDRVQNDIPDDDFEDTLDDERPDLASELARVKESLREARQLLSALQRNVATAPVAQVREPKVNKPTEFGGKLSEYSTFISQCLLTFIMCPASYQTDQQKVLFVISYLVETARKWARPILEREDHPLRNDFASFKKALDDIYADRNLRQKAQDKLTYLKQTKSAAAYAAEFLEVSAPLDLGENGQRALFYKGLKTDIKKALVFLPEAESFRKLVEQCVGIDQRLFYARKEEEMAMKASKSSSKPPDQNPKQPKSQNNDSKKARSSVGPSNSGNRSQSGNSPPPKQQQSDRPRGPISEEERQRRRDEKLCFRCGKSDHMVKDCPLNQENATNVSVRPVYPVPSMPQENWLSQATMRQVP